MTRHSRLAAALVVLGAAIVAVDLTPGSPMAVGGDAMGSTASPFASRSPSPVPDPGHEVFGYVPWWEMDDGIAGHVASTPLTTLALFSVTHTASGQLATDERGYRRIVAPIGAALIAGARARGVRVEVVYTSFGYEKNARLLSDRSLQDRTVASLVAFAVEHGFDGINVDVEQLEAADIPAYAEFVGRLREAVRAAIPGGEVSAATGANRTGAAMALAAASAGADRIFLMGYDYHWAGSEPGASAPLDRRDGGDRDLSWSLDLYRDLGVPVERTILGLPLYGMAWPAVSADIGATSVGRGSVWIPRHNLRVLGDPSVEPTIDPLEGVEFLALPDGDGWNAVYFDSPATLARKLALADERGLAGAGFWALGYERGLPGYTDLISTFHAGDLHVP